MIVDDVHEDFETSPVQFAHHLLEVGHLTALGSFARIAALREKKPIELYPQ